MNNGHYKKCNTASQPILCTPQLTVTLLSSLQSTLSLLKCPSAATVVSTLSATQHRHLGIMQTALRANVLHGPRVWPRVPQQQAHLHISQPVPAAAAASTNKRWQPCPQQLVQQQQRCVHAHAYQFKQGPDASDRVLAALPYLLPLLDALPYGR